MRQPSPLFDHLAYRGAPVGDTSIVRSSGRHRSTIVADDGDHRHGTVNGFTNLSCRCRPCTVAHAADNKERRRRRQVAKRRGQYMLPKKYAPLPKGDVSASRRDHPPRLTFKPALHRYRCDVCGAGFFDRRELSGHGCAA